MNSPLLHIEKSSAYDILFEQSLKVGGVSEWLRSRSRKSVDLAVLVGSSPTASANFYFILKSFDYLLVFTD